MVLEGERVKLVPLTSNFFDDLLQVGRAKEIWAHISIDGSDSDTLLRELKSAVIRRSTGEQYPFVIIDKLHNKVIGSTRFYNIYPAHRKLEIGWTWYDPAYWGTTYNPECKLLLLEYCFETLKTVRVQFQTSEHNMRSRKAIQKIGGVYEGILRNERILPDGSIRNTAMFSIIQDEWPEVKQRLKNRIK